MKKKSLLIISALALSATLFTGCGVRLGITSRENKHNKLVEFIDNTVSNGITIGDNSNNTPSKLYNEDLHQKISIDGINNLDISILASDVTIKAISGDDVTLDCTGSSSIVKSTSFEKSRDTLVIQENGLNSINFNGFNSSTGRKVLIGIPESFIGDATITCGAGSVTINDSTFKSLVVEGGAGELNLSNIIFNDLSLEQGMGETTIDLNGKCGDMDISGGMGEFYLKLVEVGGDLTYSGGMGEATIDIPDNAPIKLITDTGLGDTNISATTSGENTYVFDLSVGMGSLTVK